MTHHVTGFRVQANGGTIRIRGGGSGVQSKTLAQSLAGTRRARQGGWGCGVAPNEMAHPEKPENSSKP
jgi:hypothetical protein